MLGLLMSEVGGACPGVCIEVLFVWFSVVDGQDVERDRVTSFLSLASDRLGCSVLKSQKEDKTQVIQES